MYRIQFLTLALILTLSLRPGLASAIQFFGEESSTPFETYYQPNEGTPITFSQAPVRKGITLNTTMQSLQHNVPLARFFALLALVVGVLGGGEAAAMMASYEVKLFCR